MTSVLLALVTTLSMQDAILISNKIEEQAKIYQLDPNLIAAIMYTESRFNKNAIGASHGERGLMQLHPVYFGPVPLDIDKNIEIGVKSLSYARNKCYNRYREAWVVCYNAGVNTKIRDAHSFAYYKKVTAAYERIQEEEQKNLHSGAYSSRRVASSYSSLPQ